MTSNLKPYDQVRVVSDRFWKEGAPRGTIGYIVEAYPDGALEVEVSSKDGTTVAQFVAREEDLELAEPRGGATKSLGQGYLAKPPSGRGPGVLVLHPWWGLTDFVRGVCDRLAEEGFVVFAPDLYHGPTAATIKEAERLESTLTIAQIRTDLALAVIELRAQPGVADHSLGLIGFSLGAFHGLELAAERGVDFGAVVVYYGARDAAYEKAHAAFLGHFAETDPYASDAEVKEFEERLRAAGREVTIHVYPGTGHWFFEEDRKDAYNPEAARLSWDRTIAFLKKQLR